MTGCAASYQTGEHEDFNTYRQCGRTAKTIRYCSINTGVIFRMPMCDAHGELWDLDAKDRGVKSARFEEEGASGGG